MNPSKQLVSDLEVSHKQIYQVQVKVSDWVGNKSSECLSKALVIKLSEGPEKALLSYKECTKPSADKALSFADQVDEINSSLERISKTSLLLFKSTLTVADIVPLEIEIKALQRRLDSLQIEVLKEVEGAK